MSISTSNSLLNLQLTNSIGSLRDRISTVSEEAVTGRFNDLVTHLDGRIDRAFLTQKAVDDVRSEQDRLSLRGARLDLSQLALTNVHNTIGDLPVRILGAVGSDDQAGIRFAAQEAQGSLEEIFATLNVRHGERFLFAGDATASVPLGNSDTVIADVAALAIAAVDEADFEAQLDTYFDDPLGTFQTVIYSGSQSNTDPDSVSAIDPAIRNVVRNLAVLAASNPDTAPALLRTPSEPLENAASGITAAVLDLTQLRAQQGIKQEEIDRRSETLNQEEAVLTTAFNTLTARDQFEAAVELQDLQTNLEASFLLTNRLSSLTLSNFLR